MSTADDLQTIVRELAPLPASLSESILEEVTEQLYARFPGNDRACARLVFFVSGIATTNAEFIEQLQTVSDPWKHSMFYEFEARLQQDDRRCEDPYPVTEGAIRCFKCGQWKTQSFSLQLRSGDESMTVFVRCVTCSRNWTM